MKLSFRKLTVLAVIIELLFFLTAYYISSSWGETFKYSARYSGRFSLFIFLFTFYQFSTSKTTISNNKTLLNLLKLFAIAHIIHFGFLATNVYLNDIPLEIPKLIGGALAYLMIVIAPFKLDKITSKWQWIYFYYVAFVMIMTYVARIKGDFEGAKPFWFHYVALIALIFGSVIFGWMLIKSEKNLLRE